MKMKKKREKVRGEGGCVQRMEVIVKRKNSLFFWGGGEVVSRGGGGGSGWGGGVRVDVNGEVKLL